ncbi:unnamed protein product, partial [marine sediment metagenome]
YTSETILANDASAGNTTDVITQGGGSTSNFPFTPPTGSNKSIIGNIELNNVVSGVDTNFISNGHFMGDAGADVAYYYKTMGKNTNAGELDGLVFTCLTASGITGGTIRIYGEMYNG